MTVLPNSGRPTFSFLLPTRKRPQLVERFFRSVVETAAHPEAVEVVLAVDEDDPESQAITHDSLRVEKVVMPVGSTMGNLNRACFEASSGRYVILINDDVIVRTKDWDVTIASHFSRCEDDIALIHVNDLLFREQLCTFPILSRKACLEIGVCPAEYKRYAIDDHIYDTYNLLAHLGHPRITYLPDVVFEHENFEQLERAHKGHKGPLHVAEGQKVYVPNPEIHEQDARVFHGKLGERKRDALRLAGLIDAHRQDARRGAYERLLDDVRDPYGYRRPHFVKTVPPAGRGGAAGAAAAVTVAVVTSDIYKRHARRCLAALKKHTSNFDLVILDNNGGGDFVHAREMNKVLRAVRTDYLVLMDDDVFVEEGWLGGLLAAVDDETAVVAPVHKDGGGAVSFSGVYLRGDGQGTHAHLTDRPAAKRECQCLCSALLLLDLKKCGDIPFDENYKKYFFDLTHGLKVWEAGYKVVCTPDVVVTHLGGATLKYSTTQSQQFYNRDLKTFVAEWVETGRLARIEEGVWSRYPALRQLTSIPERINRLPGEVRGRDGAAFEAELDELFALSGPYDLYRDLLRSRLRECLAACRAQGDGRKAAACEQMLARLKDVPWVQPGLVPVRLDFYNGYNLVEWGESVYAVPVTLDYTAVVSEEKRGEPGILAAESVDAVRGLVDRTLGENGGRPGGGLNRLHWQVIKFDKWACKQRSGGLLGAAAWGYREVARRIAVGGYRRLKGATR